MYSASMRDGLISLPSRQYASLRLSRRPHKAPQPCDRSVRGIARVRCRVNHAGATDFQGDGRQGEAGDTSPGGLLHRFGRGIALLPLLGIALLAPSAAHAAWRHAHTPVPDAISVGMVSNEELAGLHEARGYQYPRWQRLQWLGLPDDGATDEEVIIEDGPGRALPGSVQDVTTAARRKVQWLLRGEGSALSARTRFFAAVAGSAVLLVLLLRFAVSVADQNAAEILTTKSQNRSAGGSGGGSGGRGPDQLGGGGSGLGAAGVSAAGAALLTGNNTRGADSQRRNRLGPNTTGGSIGGTDLSGGFSVTSFLDSPPQPQVVPRPRVNEGRDEFPKRPTTPNTRYVKGSSPWFGDLTKNAAPSADSSKKNRILPIKPARQSPSGSSLPASPKSSVKEATTQIGAYQRPAFDTFQPTSPRRTEITDKSQMRPFRRPANKIAQPASPKRSEKVDKPPFEAVQRPAYDRAQPASPKQDTKARIGTFQQPVPRGAPFSAPGGTTRVAPNRKPFQRLSSDTEPLSTPNSNKVSNPVQDRLFQQSASPAASDAAVGGALDGRPGQNPATATQLPISNAISVKAAPTSKEDLDIAAIGALAAEVASSGNTSIFGDSDSLDDLAKEVAAASGSSPSAVEPLQSATEGTGKIKVKGALLAGPQGDANSKSSLWDSLWGGASKASVAESRAVTQWPWQPTVGWLRETFSPSQARPNQGRTMTVKRRGQSLMASSQLADELVRTPRRGDGSTMAERAELAVSGRPSGKARRKRPKDLAGMNTYDLFQEALETSAASNTDGKYAPLRSVLAAVPQSGPARYDMVGNLLRGAIDSNGGSLVSGLRSKYDVVWQLLASGRTSGATARPEFDPVYDLMRAAAMAADWGHNAVQPVGGWGLDIYDPLQGFENIRAPTVRSKYDPLQAVLAAEAPTGSSKYDMVGETLAAGLRAEVTPPQGGPLVGVVDWLRTVVGINQGPSEVSRYDPMTHLLATDPWKAPSGDQKYDAFTWLRTVPFEQSPTGTTIVKAGRSKLATQTPSKYDPASPLLGWLSEPVPTADDPLRAFIRRAAQGPQDSSDMGIRPALVYNTSVTGGGPIAVPVEYIGEKPVIARGRGRWPWSALSKGQQGSAESDSAAVVDSPFDAQIPAAALQFPSQPRPAAAARFDAVPDLLKLWNALAACSAQLDPLDAVSVIANRGAGSSFYGVAQSFRRMLDDNDMRRPCRALWDLAKTTQGRTSLPPVTVEASRAADALLRQLHGKPDYAPMADLLKGKSSKEVVAVVCVLHDLLLSPARPLPQLQPYDQAFA